MLCLTTWVSAKFAPGGGAATGRTRVVQEVTTVTATERREEGFSEHQRKSLRRGRVSGGSLLAGWVYSLSTEASVPAGGHRDVWGVET